MSGNIYIYIAIVAITSYLIRVLPLTLIRKPIKNRFIRSFLYYVPYVTLAVMTFPAIIDATATPLAGALALIAGIFKSVGFLRLENGRWQGNLFEEVILRRNNRFPAL